MNIGVSKKGTLDSPTTTPEIFKVADVDNDLHLEKIEINDVNKKYLDQDQVESLTSITKSNGDVLIKTKGVKDPLNMKDDYKDFIYEVINMISSIGFDELYEYFSTNKDKSYDDLILNSPLMKHSIDNYEIEKEIIKFEPMAFGGPPCKFCKESNTKVVTMQLRSRDEGETIIYVCGSNACGRSWRN